jgi:2-oxo-4-hydroxy-4-carboxy-5-ureidoimidazoline decarboxylase
MPNLDQLHSLSYPEIHEAFLRCCGSLRWVREMIDRLPFDSAEELLTASEEIESSLERSDWLEAFAAHPRIGDKDTLRKKFAATAAWCEGEQSGVDSASEEVLDKLAAGNAAYEARFGHIFIVCATGKTAAEMLAILESRLPNDPDTELRIAAGEQAKITRLRLEKL